MSTKGLRDAAIASFVIAMAVLLIGGRRTRAELRPRRPRAGSPPERVKVVPDGREVVLTFREGDRSAAP